MADKNITPIEKPYYELVFVVLVYRNIEVLRQFFASLALSYSYRVVVVNSFYDQSTEEACRSLCKEHDADFMTVPNKGFGVGNNTGCRFVMDHYLYRFLVLSNSDIMIRDINDLSLIDEHKAVYAADVRSVSSDAGTPTQNISRSISFVGLI